MTGPTIATLTAPPASGWMAKAACRDCPPGDHDDAFGLTHEQARFAAAWCARCPVADPCLDYAETRNIREGVYGGLTDSQRHRRRTPGLRP